MKKYLIQEMLRLCCKRLPRHHERENFPHFSFLIQSSQIVEYAENANMEPQKHYGYHHPSKPNGYRPKLHAEIYAYHKAKGILEDKAFQMVNFRFNKKGIMMMSKPCKTCFHLLSCLGCDCFYFSSGIDDNLLQLKVI